MGMGIVAHWSVTTSKYAPTMILSSAVELSRWFSCIIGSLLEILSFPFTIEHVPMCSSSAHRPRIVAFLNQMISIRNCFDASRKSITLRTRAKCLIYQRFTPTERDRLVVCQISAHISSHWWFKQLRHTIAYKINTTFNVCARHHPTIYMTICYPLFRQRTRTNVVSIAKIYVKQNGYVSVDSNDG